MFFFFFRADEAAHHLFLVFIDVGQVEVETDLRRLCLSAEVHQAVHAYVVLAEGGACAQVVQRYGGYGVDGLQVEVGLDGRTAEYDGTAGIENKVLANDVLQRELIDAMVYGVRAIHGEVSFIIIVGADVSVSVQGDVVTGFRVHKNLHGGFRCQVEAEIDTHVRFRLRKRGAAWGSGNVRRYCPDGSCR